LLILDHESPYPLANLGVLTGSTSFSDLQLPNIKHQQSFSSLSSGGGTPNHNVSSLSFTVDRPSISPVVKPKQEEPKSYHHGLFHRHHSPSQSHSTPGQKAVVDDHEIILDTDLGSMQGIVSKKSTPLVVDNGKLAKGEVNPVAPWEVAGSPRLAALAPMSAPMSDATWTAPESWGVRPHNSITDELGEFPEENVVTAHRQTYCLRVFRTDSTFATVSCPAQISVAELIGMLAKKFFVPGGQQWVLVHYQNNQARIMQPGERPALLQQQYLERLGYDEDEDGGGEMGRDDWSGFWRFVFMRADELSNISVRISRCIVNI
jgi:hypothetical protein